MLAAIAVLSILLVLLFGSLASVSSLYIRSEEKVLSLEAGRANLELITRELTPAVVDTRIQFVILPGEHLAPSGAQEIAPHSPAILWMAPLGGAGDLRCVGYYLTASPETRRYLLKRIYIRDDNPDGYFPRLINRDNARDLSLRTDPLSAKWFLDGWDREAFDEASERAIVSTVSSRVLALWFQPMDHFGNPIPWQSRSRIHPASDLIFNSAAYFHFAEVSPFDRGDTFVYLAQHPLVMKAHRLPPEMEIAIVMAGDVVLNRENEIPEMVNLFHPDGSLDLSGSIDAYDSRLRENGIRDFEVFTTRVKLINGG